MSGFFHHASSLFCFFGAKKLISASLQIEKAQKQRLNTILNTISQTENAKRFGVYPNMKLEDFRKSVPISHYEDWQPLIDNQRKEKKNILSNENIERYQPTSGSTSKIKWIPYTATFLNELDNAVSPWIYDLYIRCPKLRNGRHYWSLSWVPTEMRDKINGSINDDSQLLPWWKRLFTSQTMAVPESVSLAETSNDSFFATCCYLVACRDLSLISVWSPTFALNLLETIQTYRREISNTLSSGQWDKKFSSLSFLKAPKNKKAASILNEWNGDVDAAFTNKLWPNLALISAWDTSSSKAWADQLQKKFKHCDFQGKGLWATEGVVTFPFQDKYPLAINSHFYEFEDLETNRICTAWELKQGQVVRPIITTGNGILRYSTKDKLKVTEFLNQLPCLEFISRIDGVDMVGEKISPEVAVNLLRDCSSHLDIEPVSILAIQSSQLFPLPRYIMLCNSIKKIDKELKTKLRIELRDLCEKQLNKHFHYKLARDLGQLDSADVLILEDALSIYTKARIKAGMVAGNIKIEPLILWPNIELPEEFNALRETDTLISETII